MGIKQQSSVHCRLQIRSVRLYHGTRKQDSWKIYESNKQKWSYINYRRINCFLHTSQTDHDWNRWENG